MKPMERGVDEPGLNYSYDTREEDDPLASRLQGRSVKTRVEYQTIRMPGTGDTRKHPVDDVIREKSASYKAWKAGRSVGTPVAALHGRSFGDSGVVGDELVAEWKHYGFNTVEQLALMPDGVATISMPNSVRRLAADYLAEEKVTAAAEVVARREADEAARDAKMKQLEERIARYEAMLNATQEQPAKPETARV